MTQEDKELLLKDLSSRLLYGIKVKCPFDDGIYTLLSINWNKEIVVIGFMMGDMYVTSKQKLVDIKPYLRSIASMTEEEKKELKFMCNISPEFLTDVYWNNGEFGLSVVYKNNASICVDAIDWLNKNMFDYRGLISKGLAIEVTDDNNPYND